MKRWLVAMAVMLAAIMPSLALADEGTDLEKKYGVNRDPALNARLTHVGAPVILGVKRLYPQCGKSLRFKILNDQDLNACALKDGRIYVTSGMMEALADRPDAELAAVLNHEATHICQGHHGRQMKSTIWGAIGIGAAVRVFGGDWDDAKTGAQIGGGLIGSRYSKDDEYRADAGSVALLKAEGYDPRAMGRTLEMLKAKYGRGVGGTPVIGWFASHPDTGKRIENANRWAGQTVGAIPAPASSVGQVPSKPRQPYRVAVIVRDRYAGWSGFWGGQTSSDAVQSAMKQALEQTGRFVVVDRESRQDAWEEQDLGQTGRMDPETVPAKGKTVGANFFLYLDLNYYQVTQEGEIRLGNWQKGTKTRVVKAEIKGKARLVPVERSIASDTTDFLGSEIGHETEVEFNDWTRGSVEASWSSHPAGQAVEQACRRVAAYFAQQISAPHAEPQSPVTVSIPAQAPRPDLETVRQFTVHIRPDDWKGAGDPRKVTIHFPATWEKLLTGDVILIGNRGQGEMVVAKLRLNIADTNSTTLDATLFYPYYRDLNLSGKITAQFVPKD